MRDRGRHYGSACHLAAALPPGGLHSHGDRHHGTQIAGLPDPGRGDGSPQWVVAVAGVTAGYLQPAQIAGVGDSSTVPPVGDQPERIPDVELQVLPALGEPAGGEAAARAAPVTVRRNVNPAGASTGARMAAPGFKTLTASAESAIAPSAERDPGEPAMSHSDRCPRELPSSQEATRSTAPADPLRRPATVTPQRATHDAAEPQEHHCAGGRSI